MRPESPSVEPHADFTPTADVEAEARVAEALAPLVLRRTRLLLWLSFSLGIGFTAVELLFAPKLGPHTVVKFCGLTAIILALVASHRPWGMRRISWLAIIVVTGGYVLTALSGALSPSHEYATSATLFIAAALSTATLLPWGAWAQLASVTVATLALGANVIWADGTLSIADSDPSLAVLLAFAASVAIAREMYRSRREAIRHYTFRSHAEREVRGLNATLEQRVLQRTGELVRANERLEAEIEERVRMTGALLESQQRLVDVVDHSTALVSLKDTDGRYLLVNREFERILHLTRQSVIGHTDEEIFPPDRAAEQHARDSQVLADGQPHSFDDEIPAAGGPLSYVTVKFALRGPEGRPYGVGTISTDITRLKWAEEQAVTHQEDLAHVQRLHLVNQMAAVLAHEINQPLGAIANFAQGSVHRMRAGSIDLAVLLPVLEKIGAEALRAGGILRSVRRLVTRQSSAPEAVDVNAAVIEVARMLEIQARRNQVQLHVVTTPTRPFVMADKTQVEQVLVNLLMNGIDAVAPVQGTRQVNIATQIEGEAVAITVSDNGPGIAPEALDKVFVPFFTTKTNGLGMGLAISRSIVEAHGGALDLSPAGGRGAAFRIALPLADSRPAILGPQALHTVSVLGDATPATHPRRLAH